MLKEKSGAQHVKLGKRLTETGTKMNLIIESGTTHMIKDLQET
jgi:hypothetical protein